jgi:hypothetical protein
MKGSIMSVRDEIGALVIRLAGAPICDDCIADRLGLSVRQHANHKTRELAGTRGYERRIDPCSICAQPKKVIRHAAD